MVDLGQGGGLGTGGAQAGGARLSSKALNPRAAVHIGGEEESSSVMV